MCARRGWIINGNEYAGSSSQITEVSILPLGKRHADDARRLTAEAIFLPVKEPEGAILDDGPTNGSSELVVAQGQPSCGKGIASVKLVVAQKFVQRAVKLICSGLRHQIDRSAGSKTNLRRHGATLYLEFLDSVHSWRDTDFTHIAQNIVVAVEHLRVHRIRAAVNAE